MADNGRTVVVYRARVDPEGPTSLAAVEFEHVALMKFGYPNDEGIRSHSLFDLDGDLWPYAMYEVHESPWIDEFVKDLRVTFPPESDFSGIRHFIFVFHDDTLEVLCVGFKVLSEEETTKLNGLTSQWVR
jgi:hypothetical protein